MSSSVKSLELVSKVSSASVDDMRAATSSNFAKQSSVYLRGYTSGCFARFPRLASHLANLATKLFLRPVLVVFLSIFLCVITNVASAQQSPLGSNDELDKQALVLYQQVMSPFCPGRALSDCPSSKAHDLKSEMRQKLEAGTAPDVVLEEVFAKYGDQYRAVPGFSGFALLAWVAPLAFLVGGLLLAIRLASARRASAPSAHVDSAPQISEGLQREIDEELSRIE
jgi:cytochrome c-type biogenesis protein CcmH